MNSLKNNFKNHSLNYNFITFFISLIGIYLFSAYIQFTTSMNIDACNALHEATLLFSGGKYFFDFYETTPPMFLYFDFPMVFILKHYPELNFFMVFFLYYLTLSTMTVALSYFIVNKIFKDTENIQKSIFLLTIAFVLLVQPPYFFGQREHTALILTIPYFLLFALRLESKKIDTVLTVIIAILASVGFAIKPQFCLAFFLTEIVLLIKRKSLFNIIRIENSIIYSVFIPYTISTYMLYPAYFHVIIPLTLKFYYVGISQPFSSLFFQKHFIFALLTMIFFLLERKNNPKKILCDAMFIGILGYMLSYISEMVPWDYHIFTTFAFSIILNALLLVAFFINKNESTLRRIAYVFFVFLVYLFNTLKIPNVYQSHLVLFFCLLGFELAWFFKSYFCKKTLHIMSTLFLALLIFIFPISSEFFAYKTGAFVKMINQPIVYFLNKYAYNKPVYFFESVLNYEYPPVDYAGAIHISRFCYLLWLPSYLKEMLKDPDSKETLKLKKIHEYFMKLMSEDIARKKPEFIFVDASEYIATPVFVIKNFQYLTLFSKTPEFQAVWKKYHYFDSINIVPYYKLDVYELNH